ncbi:hypothetical protein M011DRAFT_407328, partial [Sporormia fimetaria CBS 119925]
SPNDTYPFLSRFVTKSGSSQADYWVRDLELMHHWTVKTYYSLASKEEVRNFWCVEAPKQAVHHPHLLHEILAISALHKAYLEPAERSTFYALGIHHQDLAIKEMRKALPKLTPQSSGAMLATSALISLTSLATTGLMAHDGSTRPRPSADDLVDVFALQQGMYSILHQNHSHVLDGPFAILVRHHTHPSTIGPEDPEQPILSAIAAQMPSVVAAIEKQQMVPTVRVEVLAAIASLTSCLEFANIPGASTRELRFIFLWPNRLSSVYCTMLRRKEPAALVVLCYYVVAFYASESVYWFCEGWADRVVRNIADTIGHDPIWRPMIQWPWDTVIGPEQGHTQGTGNHIPQHTASHSDHTA